MKTFEVTVTTLPCPFCGQQPQINRGKLTGCQLHGEPIQCVVIRCPNPNCHVQPNLKPYGDLYDCSKDATTVIQEAVDLWNTQIQGTLKLRNIKV